MERYNRSNGVQVAWDQTQRELQCCGVNNATDWRLVPDSCCQHFHVGCARMQQPAFFQAGCVQVSCF